MSVTTGVMDIERLDAPGRSPTEERNVAKARDVFLALSKSEFPFFYASLAPGAHVEVIGLTAEKLGPQAKNANLVPETFTKGMRFEIKQALAEGDLVCVQWEDEADTAKGKTYRNKGLSLFRFDTEGRITSYYEYFDPDPFLEVI